MQLKRTILSSLLTSFIRNGDIYLEGSAKLIIVEMKRNADIIIGYICFVLFCFNCFMLLCSLLILQSWVLVQIILYTELYVSETLILILQSLLLYSICY
jgi:hypothetical protein